MRKSISLAIIFLLFEVLSASGNELPITAEELHKRLYNAAQRSLTGTDGNPIKIGKLTSMERQNGEPGYYIKVGDFVTITGPVNGENSCVKSIEINTMVNEVLGEKVLIDTMTAFGFSSGYLMTLFADDLDEHAKMMGLITSAMGDIEKGKSKTKKNEKFRHVIAEIEIVGKSEMIYFRTSVFPR